MLDIYKLAALQEQGYASSRPLYLSFRFVQF